MLEAESSGGQLRLLLTDFPLGDRTVKNVIVTFSKIEIHSAAEGWLTLVDYGEAGSSFDLLTLQNGVTAELGLYNLKPGIYNQLRFQLKRENEITIEENGIVTTHPLSIPSGEKSGLKLIRNIEILGTGITTVTVDFDARKSVRRTGRGDYSLRPTLTIIDYHLQATLEREITTESGGKLLLPGVINLEIPPDALSVDTSITIQPTFHYPFISDFHTLGTVFELGPGGTQFNTPANLTLYYDSTTVVAAGVDENHLDIYYFDETQNRWQPTFATVDPDTRSVTANINHFTPFVLGVHFNRLLLQFDSRSDSAPYRNLSRVRRFLQGYNIHSVTKLTDPELSSRYRAAVQERNPAITTEQLSSVINSLESGYLIELESSRSSVVLAALDSIKSSSGVRQASIDRLLRTQQTTPDDTYYASDDLPGNLGDGQWSLRRVGADFAWDTSTGSDGVVVGIIDTGIDCSHPDLQGSCTLGIDAINLVKDPERGVVGAFTIPDSCRDFDQPCDLNEDTDLGTHGTKMAGIIGANGNDGQGVVGVAWNVKLMPIRVCWDDENCSTSGMGYGLDYAVAAGVDLVNISLVSYEGWDLDRYVQPAIERAYHANVLIVASAGNGELTGGSGSNGKDLDNFFNNNYPASYEHDNIIAVGSSDRNDERKAREYSHTENSIDYYYGGSHYGALTVDLFAPGDDIIAPLRGGGYTVGMGTSQSAALVTGAAALLLSANPTLNWKELKDAILSTVDPIPALNGLCASGGRLNLASAMSRVATPTAPERVGFYSYLNTTNNDRFYTSNPDGERLGPAYEYQENLGFLLAPDSAAVAATPLFEFATPGEHFSQRSYFYRRPGEVLLKNLEGYEYQGVVGYLRNNPGPDTVPLTRYFYPDHGEYQYLTTMGYQQIPLPGYDPTETTVVGHISISSIVNTAPLYHCRAYVNLNYDDYIEVFDNHYRTTEAPDDYPTCCGIYYYINEQLINHFEYEGTLGYIASTPPAPGLIPVYRWRSDKLNDHFYTPDPNGGGISKSDYRFVDLAGYLYDTQLLDTVPLYYYYSAATGDQYYTLLDEGAKSGYVKVTGYIYSAP